MKVYVTKYALTKGITIADGDTSTAHPDMFRGKGVWEFYHGDDWHETEQAAKDRAEAMRVKKIASLKKQLARLEKLKF